MLYSMTQRKISLLALHVLKFSECTLYLAASYNLDHSYMSLEKKSYHKVNNFFRITFYKFIVVDENINMIFV